MRLRHRPPAFDELFRQHLIIRIDLIRQAMAELATSGADRVGLALAEQMRDAVIEHGVALSQISFTLCVLVSPMTSFLAQSRKHRLTVPSELTAMA